MKKNTYRKDIQGMRAIAVLLVIFFHLGITCVSGGLLGVDIFFVISGFLITSIINRDIINGNFQFRIFYLRRMRRILPALLTVLFFTTLVAVIILLPQDLAHYSSSLLASLTSVANIYFWRIVPTGYFQDNTHYVPLIHIWSLGVEEQFYIFWPLLLFYGIKFLSRKTFCIVLGLITVISALSSVCLWIYGHTSVAFYSPTSRAFELLFGCMFALYGLKIPRLTNVWNQWCSLFGLSVIIFTTCFTNPNSALSGCWEVITCFGTLLLIYSGTHHETIVSSLLSSRVFYFIGLISYSLYLWHWPILAYTHDLNIQMTAQIKLLIFLVSILLAFLSWKFIENPFRKTKKFSFSKTFIYLLVIPILCAITFMFFVRVTHGYERRFSNKIDKIYNLSITPGYSVLGDCFGGDPEKPTPEKDCFIGDKTKSRTKVLLVGDSHAAADINMISDMLKRAKLKGYVVTLGAAAYLPGVSSPSYETKAMRARNSAITNIIKKHDFKYVVMGGIWAAYNNDLVNVKLCKSEDYSLLRKGLITALSIITSQSAIPVIILDTPPPLIFKSKMPNYFRSI